MMDFSTKKMLKKRDNPLFNSVIYDSGCDSFLTHDRSRFVGDILPVSFDLWCDTPIGEMLVEGYGTMKVIEKKDDGSTIELLFKNTAYVPTSTVTLVSAIKMREEGGAVWDMDSDHLRVQKNRREICKIQVHYRLAVLEYNEVQSEPPGTYGWVIADRK